MNVSLNEFNNSVGIAHSALTTRAKFIAAVIATVLSRNLPLPQNKVSAPEDFYNIECVPVINEILSALNEKLVMDVRAAVEFTRKFWKIRYMAAFPEGLNNLHDQYGMIDTYVGAGIVWAKTEHEFINDCKDGILVTYSKAFNLLAELFPEHFSK
ncbi:MAG: hypothetical protein M0R77_01045 [Gammaproteobacteria bacterium]|nr:hypothetical protein [Acholeplasmataceae bacterium]MCK9529142.1 hypothetical protein [Gammaproteobacteria bacterium]